MGRRLIAQNVAEEAEIELPTNGNPNTPVDSEEEPVEDVEEAAIPEYSKDMTRLELEEIGLEMGLHPEDLKNAPNKAALITLLDEAKAELELEDLPDLNAAEAIK